MSSIYHDQEQQLKRDARHFIDELNRMQRELADLNRDLETIEGKADDMGMLAAKYALRAAYAKISQAGQTMVEAHLALTSGPLSTDSSGYLEVVLHDQSG